MDQSKIIMLNNVINHNKIVELESKNYEEKQKFNNKSKQLKSALDEYKGKNDLLIENLRNNIKDLTDKNENLLNEKAKLEAENNMYFQAISKLPKLIRKIFIKEKMLSD